MMRVVACLASATLLTMSCRTEEPVQSSPPSALDGEGASLVEETRAEPTPLEAADDLVQRDAPESEKPGSSDEAPTDVATPEAATAEVALPPEAEVKERDLSAELNAAIGMPRDCVEDFERATPTTIRISVTALVRPSGAILQPTASGTGLSSQARQCVARRVGAVILNPLDGDVSQRVSTVVEIPYVPPQQPVGTKVGAPDPALRNVREPLPPRREVAPSGRPIQEPTSRPIQDPSSRPIQERDSRRIRGPEPRPIDGWEVDEGAKEWR